MSVYFYGCVTLDGYLAGKNHELDWLHQTGAAEDTGYEDFYAHMNVTLMGRRTFRELVDRLIVQVAPVLLGAGIPLFTQKEALRRFRLEEVRKYGQFAELVYGRP
nr:hypothetical protein [uncultured Oscillibacter sp.]